MKLKFVAATLISAVLMACSLGLARAETQAPDQVEAFVALSGMQSQLLEAALALTLLAEPGQVDAFSQALVAYDLHAARFERLAPIGKPGHEQLTKYFNMLAERRTQVEAIVTALLKKVEQTGQGSDYLVRSLNIAFSRLGYALKRTMQHLAKDLAAGSGARNQRFSEALAIMGMNGSFFGAVSDCFTQAAQREYIVEVSFWNSLADYQLYASIYRLMAGLSRPENKAKAEVFNQITALYHRVLSDGEKLIDSAKSGPAPDLAAARAVREAALEVSPLFYRLMALTVK